MPPIHLTRTTTDPAEAERLVQPVRGRRPRRRGRQAARRAVPAERPHDAQDQARAHRRRRASRATGCTRPRRRRSRCSARCCSACTPTAGCSTSASRRRSPPTRRAELIEELQPLVCEDLSEHPWGEWSEWAIANPDRVPGTQSRWSAGQGPVVHAAAARAGPRGRLRPHGGQPVPAHRAVQALADRPRPGVLRLRAARGAGRATTWPRCSGADRRRAGLRCEP